MNRTRVLVLVAALAVAVGVLAVVLISRDSEADWKHVGVARVGFSDNRSTVWAQTDTYHSASCTNLRIDVNRDQTPWRVGVEVQPFADACTAEAGIATPPSPASGVVVAPNTGDGPTTSNLVSLTLDEPAPAEVTLAIEQPEPDDEN